MQIICYYRKFLALIAFSFCLLSFAFGQQTIIVDSTQPHVRKVIAGVGFAASNWKRSLWGSNYRDEWTTAITVPVLNMDSAFGGLTPIELGGGRQTKTLHLQDKQGRHYVLRSVNKTYSSILPPLARGTFVESVANDQTSTLHPYAALTVPVMAGAARIYHAQPKLYLVPPSNRLGQFNNLFGNTLVMLEERPDETQIRRRNFGRPEDIDGSEKMLENVTEDSHFRVDQHAYVKARLFDMLIGDWGRHLDNWRWAQFDSGEKEYYQPIPKDRDQLFARFEGRLLKAIISVAGLKQLQSFGPTIEDITWYNYPAMDIDRRFTNSLSRQVWLDSARSLQNYLTDTIIEKAVRQLPPEIFSLSGPSIIKAVKQRRDDIVKYANQYYEFLATNVDVPGTEKNESFEVKRLNNRETSVSIFKLGEHRSVKTDPLYHRVFFTNETKEIRLYGIGGNDVYTLEGSVKEGTTVRIIGGPEVDSVSDKSLVNGRTHRTKIYDRKDTRISSTPESKIRLRDTTYLYPFDEDYHYDYSTKSISPGLSPFYFLFIGAAYKSRVYGWREKPYKSDFRAGVNFSLFEKSFHPYVQLTRPQLFGAWNLQLSAGYDGARRTNFFGIGNETFIRSDERRFHRLRTENFYTTAGINRPLGQYHQLALSFFYSGVKVLPEKGRFISKENSPVDPETFGFKHFGGAAVQYRFSRLNDQLVPTKGIAYTASAAYTANIYYSSRAFTTTAAQIDFYQPLTPSFSLYIRSGGATLWGQPEFYQYNTIGSSITMRGYMRNRFFGKTVYFQQNELRFFRDVRSYLFNGKAGLIGLYDFGRVWQPGEESGKWHYGVGGGFMIAPFHKFSASVFYTLSPEDRVINFRIGRFF